MNEYPDLDKKIRLNIFCGPKKNGSKPNSTIQCDHIGSLKYNGYNVNQRGNKHRIKCVICGKRFGNKIDNYDLLVYQQKMKKITYEIFILNTNLKSIAVRWGIRREMLSRFKKKLVQQIYLQNYEKIEEKLKSLPRGIILGDETFMGQMGKSHSEVLFINDIFETLATGPVQQGELKKSILDTYNKIPEECCKKLKILMSDGEPSYKSIAKQHGGKAIHLIQYHNKKQLGQISIEKYEKVGPHHFHYIINTHWKVFAKGSHELKFNWQIKFIKENIYKRRGRPLKNSLPKKTNQKWRQKISEYQNGKIKKAGSATVYINFKNTKISKRKGSTDWMIRMMQPLFKKFKGRCATTGLIESKNHQIKHTGGDRKQQDAKYNHYLFALSSFIVENGYLPSTDLHGRPLYKYLMKESKQKILKYTTVKNNTRLIQMTLPIA